MGVQGQRCGQKTKTLENQQAKAGLAERGADIVVCDAWLHLVQK